MARITGESIKVKQKIQTGTDDFGMPIYSDEWLTIDNVLVCQPASSDIEDALTMYGARVIYTLCLPKGDANDWHDTVVELAGRGKFHTIGDAIEYTEANIPIALDWNRKVNLERTEG